MRVPARIKEMKMGRSGMEGQGQGLGPSVDPYQIYW